LQAELVQPRERGEVRARESRIRQVEVFRIRRVGTLILGRPRPSASDRHADPYTLKSEEPHKYCGKQGEFTLLAPLKPGGADKARELAKYATVDHLGRIGTLHEVRIAFLDDDTRMLFATTYDGSWDEYINDFAMDAPELLDKLWSNLEGYPGLASPDVKDYLVKYQAPVAFFWTASPDSTVTRVHKAERVLSSFEQMLDAAG
jgi:hypothetical protein